MSLLRRLTSFLTPRREAADQPVVPPVKTPAVPVLAVGDLAPTKPVPEAKAASGLVLDYSSWELVPPSVWIWPHFKPRELACKGTGKLFVQRKALNALQALRREVGKPLVIASAYRSPAHNAKVGGAKDSRHMNGDAFDIVLTGHDPAALALAAKKVGFTGFGFYPNAKPPFVHLDMGPARSWGSWDEQTPDKKSFSI
jgi:hypothetical protein